MMPLTFFLQFLYNSQHNGLLSPKMRLDLIQHSNTLLIRVLRFQYHHISRSSINEFVVCRFDISHDVTEVAIQSAHDEC